jgi:hypothetical protein
MNEMLKEVLGELMPIIIIAIVCVVSLAVKNLAKGRKWNYLDKDSSDRM